MADNGIVYRSGYKYQLAENYELKIPIKPDADIDSMFITLDRQGNLQVKAGYAWDGTSGPVIDTPFNLRASLVHDALYQLMREKTLSAKEDKDKADKLFKKLAKEDGVPAPVAQVYYEALKKLGKPATKPESSKALKHAPK
jgi:hypothetical protein